MRTGGQLNQILPFVGAAVISGGSANTNGGSYATVPGGQNNLAGGAFSFAAGQRAKAAHQGAFVWADSQAADFSSTANNQFLIRAAGNVGINKNNPATALDVNGTVTANNFVGSGGGLTGIGAGSLGPSVDARYVLKAGDTMSGLLTTPNLAALTAVRTPWVNNDAGSVLSISSGGDIEFQIDKLGPAFSYFEVFNGAGSHVFWVDEAGNSQVYGTQIVNGDQHVDGKVGIGTNNPVAVLDVYGTRAIDATTDGVLNVGDSASSHLTLDGDDIQRKYGTTPSTLYLNYYGGNVNVCAGQLYTVFGSGVGIGTSGLSGYKLYVAGSAYSTGVWSGSDARWKKNVQPVTGALDKITQLQGVTYDWRREEFPAKQFEAGTQLGFLAQEVEKVVPEAVRTDAEGYKAIAYEKLTAVLTEGVKEQQAEIGALKARNATLEKDVAELKALVEQLLHK
jgi:Chaperone of endosialidase